MRSLEPTTAAKKWLSLCLELEVDMAHRISGSEGAVGLGKSFSKSAVNFDNLQSKGAKSQSRLFKMNIHVREIKFLRKCEHSFEPQVNGIHHFCSPVMDQPANCRKYLRVQIPV